MKTITNSLLVAAMLFIAGGAPAAVWDPGADDYAGRAGTTFYVSKLGDNSDGLSWATAFTTVQAALEAVPDALGGHRVIVRPDTYMEANLSVAYPGAAGSYNLLIGDVDGRYGSGGSGRVILDAGDPQKGMKSYDWWGNIRSNSQGWSKEHTAPTFSAIVWDRWILRNLYATGGDGGLFWDTTNRVEPFTVVVEDCTGIGRAFGGGVGNCLSRYDEPITFRRCTLWALDWWGDTAGAYVRIENPAMPERHDVVFEDCTLVSPQCALKGGNFGFHTFMRIKVNRCRLVALNFSQPAGTPTDGIVQSVQNGKYVHVDFEDSTLMGYKVFGVRVDKDTAGDIGYGVKGSVQAYVQHTQDVPKGMLRLGHWPAEVFDRIADFSTEGHHPQRAPGAAGGVPAGSTDSTAGHHPPLPGGVPTKPVLREETLTQKDMCEVSPFVWQGRHGLLACVRPGTGGTKSDYWMEARDAATGEVLAKFGEGHSLACAYADKDAVYVFASRFENDNWNDVTVFVSRDLKNWEQKVAIVQDEGEHLFNSSVCAGPDGYAMAYETNDGAYPAFTVKFAKSADLMNWTKMPEAVFGTNRYTACPAIRFVDGYYYLMYLEHRTPRWFFETYIARSADLVKWEQSPLNPVLTPKGLDEGINASDPDLVEFEGKTHLYYAVGDQLTWMNIKHATYDGAMGGFFKPYFATGGVPEPGDLAGYRARKDTEAKQARIGWFNEAKFGLFVHWGPFAVQGADTVAAFDYFEMKANAALRPEFAKYAEQFAPAAFDAAAWVEAAKSAGMKYLVFTSKHHDGYSLFDTAVSSYDSVEMAPKRDYVREIVDAARAGGLKAGLYYSMLDWREPMYEADLAKFVDQFMFGQVRELCGNYGPIDCLWFDGEWDYPASTWRADELVAMIRELQPGALVNDRLGKGERGITPLADFYTREQPSEVNVAMSFERQRRAWEACMTIGESWQYSAKDTRLKSVEELVRMLVDVASRGGNLLLNVGPDPDGRIPEPLLERLKGVGAWLAKNGESIYGTFGSPFARMPAGKCTTKDNRLYVHIESHPGAPVLLPGLQNTIQKAWLLDGGAELKFDTKAKTIELPETLPDKAVTTVVVELDAPPVVQ